MGQSQSQYKDKAGMSLQPIVQCLHAGLIEMAMIGGYLEGFFAENQDCRMISWNLSMATLLLADWTESIRKVPYPVLAVQTNSRY